MRVQSSIALSLVQPMSQRLRFGACLACLLWASCGAPTRQQPPALSGITVAALDASGQTNPALGARTLFGPPVPVIGVRPGQPPRAGSFLWNEPSSGRINIVLARGRQSFTFHTTLWGEPKRFVIALFFDGSAQPEFVVATGGTAEHQPTALRALGLDGELLSPQLSKSRAILRGFEITLEEFHFPHLEWRLDLVGPWRLRPDNIADMVGVVVMTVREVNARG